MIITDGSIDCTQLSARAGYPDQNGCDHDWEDPSNIITMRKNANQDAHKPIESFIMGVPGADTFPAS